MSEKDNWCSSQLSGAVVRGMIGVQFIHTGNFLNKLQKRVKIADPWHHGALLVIDRTKQANIGILKKVLSDMKYIEIYITNF